MKLSDAIRLGAMLKPQAACIHSPHAGGSTCGIGAAADAIGALGRPYDIASDQFAMRAVEERWPAVTKASAECAACGASLYGLLMIQHLNDVHHWTRERIADWVETLELQQAVAAVDPALPIAELTADHAREKVCAGS